MGIIYNNALLLSKAKAESTNFENILTLGHQTLYITKKELAKLASFSQINLDASEFANEPYANQFLKRLLGAKTVQSMDYSDYENCDLIHDLNFPISSALYEKYEAVIDGGSLEHIFNFPTAIKNCMEMVKPGGSIFLFTMANNHMGHGFYQFSPELFFRVFQKENGFSVKEIILENHPYSGVELSENHDCHSVIDPAKVGSRVGLITSTPVMMMVHAVKTESKTIFEKFPIQSDYQSVYDAQNKDQLVKSNKLKNLAKRLVGFFPRKYKNVIIGNRQKKTYSLSNKRFYKKWPSGY